MKRLSVSIILFVFTIIVCSGAVSASDEVAYWSLDTVTIDGEYGLFEDQFGSNTAYGNIQTVEDGVGDGKVASIRTGEPGPNVKYIRTPPDNFRFGYSAFTLSCWVKIDYIRARSIHPILTTKNVGDNTSGFSLFYFHDATRDKVVLKIADGVQNMTVSSENDYIENGKWHYIVAVRDGLDSKIYIDGVDRTESTTGDLNTLSADGTNVYFRFGTDCCNVLEGQIDEVKIYSRVMNSSEVEINYDDDIASFPMLYRVPIFTNVSIDYDTNRVFGHVYDPDTPTAPVSVFFDFAHIHKAVDRFDDGNFSFSIPTQFQYIMPYRFMLAAFNTNNNGGNSNTNVSKYSTGGM